MKVKINKTFDMEDSNLLYCESHDEHFSMLDIGKHMTCDPEPYADTKISWGDLFYKCMNVKTGPNFNDIAEGKFTEKWSENESKREQFYQKLADRIKEEGLAI